MMYVPEECIDSSEQPDTRNYTGLNFKKYSAANVKYMNTYFCQYLINTNPTKPAAILSTCSGKRKNNTDHQVWIDSLLPHPTYVQWTTSLNNKLWYLRGKGQNPVDKTTDRIRVKGDESGGGGGGDGGGGGGGGHGGHGGGGRIYTVLAWGQINKYEYEEFVE